VSYDRANDLDSTGVYAKNIDVINNVFEQLQNKYKNISVFDVTQFPHYIPSVRGNGLFT